MSLTDRKLVLYLYKELNSLLQKLQVKSQLKRGGGFRMRNYLMLAPNSLVFVLSAFVDSYS